MKSGTFMDVVGVHYDDIKRLYISRDVNRGKKFDEDSFNEAFIKCAKRFGNDLIFYDDVIKYFWIAYINTCKKDHSYKNSMEFCEEYPELEEDGENFSRQLYNTVMNAVENAFSEDDMMIYSLYKYHGWSKQDLISAGYNCNNLEIRIKTIHKFVKEFCKKNFKENFKKRR